MLFSERLEGLLKERKTTWKEVYTALHIGKNQKKYWADNDIVPEMETLLKLADYFGIGMSDLTDKRNSSDDNDIKYSDACMKIGLNDKRFKQIIIEYNEMPLARKQLLCDFFEEFIF